MEAKFQASPCLGWTVEAHLACLILSQWKNQIVQCLFFDCMVEGLIELIIQFLVALDIDGSKCFGQFLDRFIEAGSGCFIHSICSRPNGRLF